MAASNLSPAMRDALSTANEHDEVVGQYRTLAALERRELVEGIDMLDPRGIFTARITAAGKAEGDQFSDDPS